MVVLSERQQRILEFIKASRIAWLQPYADQFEHVPWEGFRFLDLVMPLFLFIVGVVMPFSFGKRRDRGDSRADALSGGQQQRVAIARALITEPALLMADEPTGNLDSAMGCGIMELLSSLNRERGLTIVMVTHESDMARYARRTVRFHDGRVASDDANGRS